MTTTQDSGSTMYLQVLPLTKKSIIQRLYDQKAISFDEMLILLEKETVYVPPYIPDTPQFPPYPTWITTSNYNVTNSDKTVKND